MFAVLDTETTGLNPSADRIIELAVIGLDRFGNKEWEWCSLINPERNTGNGFAVRIHQIYDKDVAGAPTFRQFAGKLISLLRGRAVIAHNAGFDLRMLSAEFSRLGIAVPSLPHICTADIARDLGFKPWRLESCCSSLGIQMDGMHHALADARATWALAQHLLDFADESVQEWLSLDPSFDSHWPELPIGASDPVLRPVRPARIGSAPRAKMVATAFENRPSSAPSIATFSPDSEGPIADYVAAVELVIEDREVFDEQKVVLNDLQEQLNLTEEQVRSAKLIFLQGLAGSMWDDGEISAHERFDLEVVATALGLPQTEINFALSNPLDVGLLNEDYALQPGDKVVFTGEMSLSRSEWKTRAENAGLKVTGSVSGKTNWLVVPSIVTGSGKSKKARELGVRVISEQRFLRMIKRREKEAS